MKNSLLGEKKKKKAQGVTVSKTLKKKSQLLGGGK